MTDDDEIRVKCAEAMGFKIKKLTGLWPGAYDITYPDGTQFSQCDFAEIPDYPDDPVAALTLCDRMREEDFDILITIEKTGYTVNVYIGQMGLVEIEDPSLTRAICLAFLKTQQPTEQETP